METSELPDSDYKDSGKSILNTEWIIIGIATLGVLLSMVLWYAFTIEANSNLSYLIKLQSEHLAEDIQTQIELRISALKHMAQHLSGATDVTEANWQLNAAELNDYTSFEVSTLVNPDLSFKWTYLKSKTDHSQILKDFVQNNKERLLDPATKEQIWLAPSINFEGVIVVVPVKNLDASLKGYLITLINLEELFKRQLNSADYTVAIYNKDMNVAQYGPALHHDFPIVTKTLNIYGSKWQINIQPSLKLISLIKTQLPNVALILGMAIAFLFAISSRLALLARQRSRLLHTANMQLQQEMIERQLAEENKFKLEKSMHQGQKLQALGTLAGGIAHDFNNMLYAISGFAEMSKEDVPKESVLYRNLDKILEASKRGQDLVSRILAFSRRQNYALNPINLKDTINGVFSLLTPALPASIELKLDVDYDGDCYILGNETQVHQVIMNLINNAADAMKSEGTVTLHLSRIPSNDPFLKDFHDLSEGMYCRIDVSDTGHGMDQATMDRIFEPFFTTKEVGKGTGLGLATAHAIVKEYLGEITVQSQKGKGTTFTILLPEVTKDGKRRK